MSLPINDYLEYMLENGGYDLLLCAGMPPAMKRGSNKVSAMPFPAVESEDIEDFLASELRPNEVETLDQELSVDFAFESAVNGGTVARRFRCNAYHQCFGYSVVFRAIPVDPPTCEELYLPTLVKNLSLLRNGLILVTGPTGVGKSSTLAAMCRYMNENRKIHIVTIEDPIEYVHHNINAMVVQRQVGMHVESFQRALRSALREDPDVIIVGELRDPETIQLAMIAAETGHLVMSTLHTNSASQTISRILNSFPASQQGHMRVMLADALRAVISQQLVMRADGQGLVPCFEILLQNDAVANTIRENKIHQLNALIETGIKQGMRMMDSDLLQWVKEGVVTGEDALCKAINQEEFCAQLNDWRKNGVVV